jgi:hypothetical protein
MSIATLKKKSQVLYNNLSVGSKNGGFSLNGGHRSAGYIGQSTQSRHLTRTLMKGNVVRGNGGCCGTYIVTNVKPSELACLNDPNAIKPTAMNTEGMLHTKYKWFWSGRQYVKPDTNQNTVQSDYISSLGKKTISCSDNSYKVPTENISNCDSLPALARRRHIPHRPVCFTTKRDYTAITQGQYIEKLDCTANNIAASSHNCNCPIYGAGSSV